MLGRLPIDGASQQMWNALQLWSGGPYLEDTGLLPRDVLQGVAQYGNMVNPKSSDPGDDWFGDNIRTVEPPTNTDFEDCGVDL